jgi:hypothetical protein
MRRGTGVALELRRFLSGVDAPKPPDSIRFQRLPENGCGFAWERPGACLTGGDRNFWLNCGLIIPASMVCGGFAVFRVFERTTRGVPNLQDWHTHSPAPPHQIVPLHSCTKTLGRYVADPMTDAGACVTSSGTRVQSIRAGKNNHGQGGRVSRPLTSPGLRSAITLA